MKHMKVIGRVTNSEGKATLLYIGKKMSHGSYRKKRHPNSKYVTANNHN